MDNYSESWRGNHLKHLTPDELYKYIGLIKRIQTYKTLGLITFWMFVILIIQTEDGPMDALGIKLSHKSEGIWLIMLIVATGVFFRLYYVAKKKRDEMVPPILYREEGY